MDICELLPLVVARWDQLGVREPGVGQGVLARLPVWSRYTIPPDLGSLLALANGMGKGSTDDLMIRFWPAEELRSVHEELPDAAWDPHADFLVFADYSIWAHAYAIQVGATSAAGTVVIVGGAEPISVASSFAEFLARYLFEPDSLFGGEQVGPP